MVIYELTHTYYKHNGNPIYSKKLLGYYSDIERIRNAISFYSNLPGFCDTQDGFVVAQKEVLGSVIDTNFYSACIFAHTEDYEDFEHEIELGLFFDENAARKAIGAFCKNNTLFLSNPLLEIEQWVDKFTINEHCGWAEGFDVALYTEK